MAGSEVAMTSSTPKLTTAELRSGLLNVEPKSAAGASLSEKRSLSSNTFRAKMEQLSAVENQNLFSQKTTIYEMSLGNFKKQFRADDDSNGADQKKRVSFVPSLGQKLPDDNR
jgi:hypothetical protein